MKIPYELPLLLVAGVMGIFNIVAIGMIVIPLIVG